MFKRNSHSFRLFGFVAASFGLLLSFSARATEQAPAFTVPVSIIDGYIVVDVRLNGKGPFHFLFDTGADMVVLQPVAETLALKTEDGGDGFGDGEEKIHFTRTKIENLQIGPLQLSNRVAAVVPPADVQAAFGKFPIAGFIGRTLLNGRVVKLDYVHRQLTFMAPEQFSYAGGGTVLPYANGRIAATLDGIRRDYLVDTATHPGLTQGRLAVAPNDSPATDEGALAGITDWGFGGPVHTRLARGQSLELGDIKVPDPLLYISLQKKGTLASTDCHLGFGILSQFDVTFDTSNSRIIFEKNANFGQKEGYDRLGMWIGQADENFVAVDVVPGGPADLAGIKPGDMITEIDGVKAADLLLPVVHEQIERRSAGDRVKLSLRSGDKPKSVVITLKERV